MGPTPQRRLHGAELQMWEQGAVPLKEAESQDSSPGWTDTQQGSCLVESDEVFDRRLQRRQRDQKRPRSQAGARRPDWGFMSGFRGSLGTGIFLPHH